MFAILQVTYPAVGTMDNQREKVRVPDDCFHADGL